MNQSKENPESNGGKSPRSKQLNADIFMAQVGAIQCINNGVLRRYDDALHMNNVLELMRVPQVQLSDCEKAAAFFSIVVSFATNTAIAAIDSGNIDLLRSLAKVCDDWCGQQKDYGGDDMTKTRPNQNLRPPTAPAEKFDASRN